VQTLANAAWLRLAMKRDTPIFANIAFMPDNTHELETLIRSRVPIILIETSEERRAVDLFRQLAIRLSQPVMRWSVTSGLQRIDLDLQPQTHAREPAQALAQIRATGTAGIYLLLDFHPYLEDPAHV